MTCGHDHCACGPGNDTIELTGRPDDPTRDAPQAREDGCCGGHTEPPAAAASDADAAHNQ